ncbi:hypothetical protein [Oceanobacillus sp. 1P07AA]|uniref:hypothetical protein n=1 Tax=Oceanobacillus sp. 1P07AA TaxID=3132293 RepID=UPI0039A72A5C
MNKIFQAENRSSDRQKQKIFSIVHGFKYFLMTNILLAIFTAIFFINKSGWQVNGSTSVEMFVAFAQPFVILLSIIAGFKPYEKIKKIKFDKEQSKEWTALLIAIILISMFSLVFLGANIPFPSTLIFGMLSMNFMVALYSIIFHPFAIRIYEANFYQGDKSLLDNVFKYLSIYLMGINYFVQKQLLKLPLIINKLVAIIFVLFLVWQMFIVVDIFNQ